MELEIGLWQKCWWNPTLIWNWRNLTVITLDMFISFLDICTVTGFMRTVVVGCCWVPKTCYANPSNWLKYRMTPTQTRKTGRKPWISGILLGIPWKIGLQNLSHLGSAVLSSGNLICFGRGCHSRCSSNIWYRVGIILSLQYIKQSIQNPFCLSYAMFIVRRYAMFIVRRGWCLSHCNRYSFAARSCTKLLPPRTLWMQIGRWSVTA